MFVSNRFIFAVMSSKRFYQPARGLAGASATIVCVATLASVGCSDVANGSGGDPPEPAKIWFARIAENTRSGWLGLPATSGDDVIVATGGGIVALNMAGGQRKWSATLWSSGYAPNSVGIAVQDEEACMSDAWAIGCVDIATGRALWLTQSPPPEPRADTSIDDSTWYVGSRSSETANHRVYAFDAATGATRWVTDMVPAAEFKDTPTGVLGTVVSGDTVYATTVRWLTYQGGSTAGDLVALDRRTGTVLWSYTTPAPKGGFQGAAVIYGRLAIMNDVYWHGLVAVDRFTGQEVWRTEKNERGYISSERPPILVGDTLFAASTDTQIYAVNARTGKRIWQAFANRGSLGSLAVCGSQLLVTEFGPGAVVAMDRLSHVPRVLSGLEPGDDVTSRIAVKDNVAVFTSRYGAYAYRCN